MENVLYHFGDNGIQPFGGVIFDAAGNLYGTTSQGGAYDSGTVFELTPTAGGGWMENVLYRFGDKIMDGKNPLAGLTFDAAGSLYGTTIFGGAYGGGTVFALTPTAGGSWTEKVLHSFYYNGTDGIEPIGGVIFDAAGSLYGTTDGGGAGGGIVFEFTPTAGGSWTEKVLHSFHYNGTDGIRPDAGLIFDAAGSLYGTTTQGGAYDRGTVFELTPVHPCSKCTHSVLR